MSVNEDFHDDLLLEATTEEDQTTKRVAVLLALLAVMDDQLVDQILSARSFGTTATTTAVERAIRQFNRVADSTYTDLLDQLEEGLLGVATRVQESFYQLARLAGLDLGKEQLTRTALKELVGELLVNGLPLKDWTLGQRESVKRRVAQELRLAGMGKEDLSRVLERLLGADRGKVRQGGALNMAKAQAANLVRTAHAAIAQQTLWNLYRAHKAVIKAVMALVTMDMRTSPICRPRQGWAWEMNGKPAEGVGVKPPIRFPGPPPWHWCCRTFLVPVFKAAALASSQTGADIGSAPSAVSFEEWLKRVETRSPGRAKQVLGAYRYDLWKSGRLTLADLYDKRGTLLPVATLKKKYPPS